MSYTATQLKTHPIWSSVEGVRQAVEVFDVPADPNVLERIASLVQLTEAVERLRDVPAWRFSGTPGGAGDYLAPLSTALTNAANAIRSAQSSPESLLGALESTIDVHMDEALAALARLPMPAVTSGHLKGITTATEEYSQLVGRVVASLGERHDELQRDLTVLREAIAASQGEAQASLVSLQEQINTSKTDVTSQVSRLDTAITNQTDVFNRLTSEWSANHDAAVSAFESDVAERVAQFDSATTQALDQQKAAGEAVLASLEALKDQAEAMVQVTARNTISTEYAQYARRQGIAATIWSVLAVLAALGGSVFVIRTLSEIQGLSTAEAIFKSTASLAVLGTAGVMATEAAGHRREARDAKRVQLDLNALEPFLANLGDKAEDIRIETVKRIFSRPPANERRTSLNPMSRGGAPD